MNSEITYQQKRKIQHLANTQLNAVSAGEKTHWEKCNFTFGNHKENEGWIMPFCALTKPEINF